MSRTVPAEAAKKRRFPLLSLIILLGGSGFLHLVKPAPYVKIVPRVLPAPELLVLVSGIAELILATMLVLPKTRRAAGWMTGLFLLAVFPANVQMFSDARPLTMRWWLLLGRLPLQAVFIYWSILIWKGGYEANYPSGSGASNSPTGRSDFVRK